MIITSSFRKRLGLRGLGWGRKRGTRTQGTGDTPIFAFLQTPRKIRRVL